MQHSKYSPSSAHRWLKCTGSLALEREYIKENPEVTIPKPHMTEGTIAHKVAEEEVKILFEESNSIPEIEGANAEMKKHAKEYADYIASILYATSEPFAQEIEYKCNFEEVAKGGFGTADCIIANGDIVHIVDYKYGKGVKVFAEKNEQLLLYAIGFYLEHDFLLNDDFKIKVHIFQPRLDHIDTWEISEEYLKTEIKQIKNTVKNIESGHVTYEQGDHCRFCVAQTTCPKQKEMIEQVLSTEDLSQNEFVKYILDNEKTLENLIKKAKAKAIDLINSGQEVEGYKLIQSMSNRKITDQDAFIKAVIENGFNKELLFERKLLSITQLEKQVGKELIEQHTVRTTNGCKLVPITDKRPSVSSVEIDFKGVI